MERANSWPWLIFLLIAALVAGTAAAVLSRERPAPEAPASAAKETAPPGPAAATAKSPPVLTPKSTPAPPPFELVEVASELAPVTDIQFVPGQPNLMVVLEKRGRARLVRLVPGRTVTPHASLLSLPVREASEQGLLGLAFHPRFADNGRLFLNYNPKAGERRTVIAEWQVDPKELGRSQAHEHTRLLEVPQPYPNHDAGQLAFGPDGKLYIGLGDGGAAADPHGNGQDRSTLLGSMLRVTVEVPGKPYGIPEDNPFVDLPNVRPEIWAYGLRNPWRFSFDREGRMVVGDVGQNRYEEIDLVGRGDNLGWNRREASHCFEPAQGCQTRGLVEPIFEYGRAMGTSVTGGHVYTGSAVPELRGKYVFGDFGSGRLWALDLPPVADSAEYRPGRARELGVWPIVPSTFGQNAAGEIFVADFGAGRIYQLMPRS